MSAAVAVLAGDDPPNPAGEVKLSLPETWQVESVGKQRQTVCLASVGELRRRPAPASDEGRRPG
ncbi:hypothetical protein OH76DRAFT_1361388 [Lentinus brumalis]|uniref:Uncharacterized protein n=1 Tax=Lentinus brumalis TaxID=2498619 RepID=A0A371CSQ0_9APHY|nr:hypothetical protein OH76DRAFT_1361388 [Polyporus brumalis]